MTTHHRTIVARCALGLLLFFCVSQFGCMDVFETASRGYREETAADWDVMLASGDTIKQISVYAIRNDFLLIKTEPAGLSPFSSGGPVTFVPIDSVVGFGENPDQKADRVTLLRLGASILGSLLIVGSIVEAKDPKSKGLAPVGIITGVGAIGYGFLSSSYKATTYDLNGLDNQQKVEMIEKALRR